MRQADVRFIVRTMRTLAFVLMVAGISAVATAAESGGAPVDANELIRLVRQDCGSCHGMTLQGGLGTPLTREALAGKPADYLATVILYGRLGTAMPAWKTLLSEAQANWIADRLLGGFPEERR
jgi:cytochrome c55X